VTIYPIVCTEEKYRDVEERMSYGFRMIWGYVLLIYGWTIRMCCFVTLYWSCEQTHKTQSWSLFL